MKLWLLTPIDEDNGPWNPWYDKAFGFVVRAETESDARRLAHASGGDENRKDPVICPWLDSRFSDCVELLPDGPEDVVMQDFRAA